MGHLPPESVKRAWVLSNHAPPSLTRKKEKEKSLPPTPGPTRNLSPPPHQLLPDPNGICRSPGHCGGWWSEGGEGFDGQGPEERKREGEREGVCVCKGGGVGIRSLKLRNDVAGPWSAGLEPSPHSLRNTQALRYILLSPFSDWVGSRVGQAAGESAHSPAPALCPNNAASPSPCLYPAGYLAAAARDRPLPSLLSLPSRPAGSSNRPFARQLEGWGGSEV